MVSLRKIVDKTRTNTYNRTQTKLAEMIEYCIKIATTLTKPISTFEIVLVLKVKLSSNELWHIGFD